MTAGGRSANTALVCTGRVIVRPRALRQRAARAAPPSRSRARRQRSHSSSVSSASNWAARNRIFDASCSDCLRRYSNPSARARVEHHDRLGAEQPVLGAAEREEVDARSGRHLRQRDAERGGGVATAARRRCAAQPALVRQLGQRRASPPARSSVPSSVRLRDRQHPGLTACSSPTRADPAASTARA